MVPAGCAASLRGRPLLDRRPCRLRARPESRRGHVGLDRTCADEHLARDKWSSRGRVQRAARPTAHSEDAVRDRSERSRADPRRQSPRAARTALRTAEQHTSKGRLHGRVVACRIVGHVHVVHRKCRPRARYGDVDPLELAHGRPRRRPAWADAVRGTVREASRSESLAPCAVASAFDRRCDLTRPRRAARREAPLDVSNQLRARRRVEEHSRAGGEAEHVPGHCRVRVASETQDLPEGDGRHL
jgi:hypothetical protein